MCPVGAKGDYAVVATTTLSQKKKKKTYYKNESGTWVEVGSSAWKSVGQ